MLDALRKVLGAGALGLAQKRHLRAEVGRVADVGDSIEGHVRQKPDRHRALDVDVVAEASAEHELGQIRIVDAHHALEQDDAGVDRALGELELADVALGEGHVLVLAGVGVPDQHELDAGLGGAQPCGERGGKPLAIARPQPPGSVHDPRSHHLRAGVDEAGPADADRARRTDDAAVDVVVDADRLDRAHRAPHAVADLRTFERGAGRRGTRHEPFLRAHDHLAVGADVDQRAQLVALVDPGREHARHGVRTHEARHDRQQADLRVRRGLERKLARGDDDAVAHRRRVGREPHERHVDAEEDVVHAGVADHHDLVDVLARNSRGPARVLDEAVDGVQHLGAQGNELLLVELRVGDARHQIAAVHGLRIDAADRGELLSGLQMQERSDDAGGADVERHAIGMLRGIAGFHVDDAAVERGDGELASLLAQLPGDLPHRRDRDAPVDRGVDGRQHLCEIGCLAVLLARGARGDDVLRHARVDREARAARNPAAGQDLVARLRLRRQRHDLAVGDRTGLAAEPEALLHLLVTELEGILHGGRRNIAGEDLAAAAPASTARAAGGVHADARGLRGVEQRDAALHPHPAHRRRVVGIDEANLDVVAVRFLHRASVLVSRSRFKKSCAISGIDSARPRKGPHIPGQAPPWERGRPARMNNW